MLKKYLYAYLLYMYVALVNPTKQTVSSLVSNSREIATRHFLKANPL